MTRIRHAVIPAAGHGTRMKPFSTLVPKELVPIGSRPALEWIVAEAVEAGIRNLGVIVGPHKGLVHRALDDLRTRGELEGVEVVYLEQPVAEGLGHALMLARDWVGARPWAVLLPDNLFPGQPATTAHLCTAASATGDHVVGALEVTAADSGRYGNSGLLEVEPEGDLLRVRRLAGKGTGRLELTGGTHWRACGRYVFQPGFFELLEGRLGKGTAGESSEVPAVQQLALEGRLVAAPLPGPLFDVGHPRGVLEASAWELARTEPVL